MSSSFRFTKLCGIQYNYDCPNPNCDGWLNTFAKTGESKPCFLRCVNSSKNENGSCTVSTIISVKDGKCIACDNKIKKVSTEENTQKNKVTYMKISRVITLYRFMYSDLLFTTQG